MDRILLSRLLFEVSRWKQEKWEQPEFLDELRPYIDQYSPSGVPLYYIHYSELPKIGINPEPEFGFTPHGIYAYPLTGIIMSAIKSRHYFFASDRPYIMLFRIKNPERILNSRTYNQNDFELDLKKLDVNVNDYFTPNKIREYSRYNPLKKLLNITRDISPIKVKKRYHEKQSGLEADTMDWRRKLVFLGYDGIVDNDTASITNDLRSQAVFFSKGAIEEISMFYNRASKTDPIHGENPSNKLSNRTPEEKQFMMLIGKLIRDYKNLTFNDKQRLVSERGVFRELVFKHIKDPMFFDGISMPELQNDTIFDKVFYGARFESNITDISVDFTNCDFSNAKIIAGHEFYACTFGNCNFDGIILNFIDFPDSTTFFKCNFDNSLLSNLVFSIANYSSFIGAKFKDCSNINLTDCDLRGTLIDDSNIIHSLVSCKRNEQDHKISGYTVENGILVKE